MGFLRENSLVNDGAAGGGPGPPDPTSRSQQQGTVAEEVLSLCSLLGGWRAGMIFI